MWQPSDRSCGFFAGLICLKHLLFGTNTPVGSLIYKLPEEIVMHRITIHVAIALVTFIIGISAAGAWNLPGKNPATEAAALKRLERPVAPSSRPSAEKELARQELLEIMRQYDMAQTRQDAAFFQKLEVESFTLNSYGKTYTLAEDIALMKGMNNDTRYTSDDLDVQLYGMNAAIVTGRMTAMHPGQGYEYSWRWIHVFIKLNGEWRILNTTQFY
jgi:hypothetical protein